MKWEEKFAPAILQSGRGLFENNKVTKMTEKNGSYTAIVTDNQEYSVHISFRRGRLSILRCNCETAAQGVHCRHMAALAYAAMVDMADAGMLAEKEEETVHRFMEQRKRYQYFDTESIRKEFKFSSSIVRKGQELIQEQRITLDEVESGYLRYSAGTGASITATGRIGRNSFPVAMTVSRDSVETVNCQCPQCRCNYYSWSNQYQKNCEYKAALMELFEDYLTTHNLGDATDRMGDAMLQAFSNKRARRLVSQVVGKNEQLKLEVKLLNKEERLLLNFKVGSSRMYVVKDLTTFIEHVRNEDAVSYGASKEMLTHSRQNFTKESQEYLDFLQKMVTEENEYFKRVQSPERFGRNTTSSVRQNIELYGWRLDAFYDLMKGKIIDYEQGIGRDKIKESLSCKEDDPDIRLMVKPEHLGLGEEFHGVRVTGKLPEIFYGVETGYFIENQYLCRMNQDFLEQVEPLLKLTKDRQLDLKIGRNHLTQFYYSTLPLLRDYIDIRESNREQIEQYLPPEGNYIFYLDVVEQVITCQAHVRYGNTELSLISHLFSQSREEGETTYRDTNREKEIVFQVRQWFPMANLEHDILYCDKSDDSVYQILTEGVENLLTLGEVQSTDAFKKLNVIRKAKVSIGVSVANGLLNLDIQSEDISREELLDILKSYRQRKKFHRLKNGTFLDVRDETYEVLAEMMDSLQISPKDFVKDKMHIPSYRALYLEKMLEENETVYASRDKHFRDLVKEFKTIQDADYEVPPSLDHTLRKYQRTGYRWLRTLAGNQFGGILADDMGLGKTLQVLTVLLAAKREGSSKPSLIVCPASLVYNWGEECAHFTPALTYSLITGNQEERKALIDDYADKDLLITSYDLLKRDIDLYEGKVFQYEVIDEAQYIKNHTTEAAKAVKIIQSQNRFALTGTPIENRLSELWSIFDYLMPGFLFRYEQFKKEFETPIVRNEDKHAMERLQKMTSPFILRRLKEDVLKDLPDKLEEVQYAKLEEEQFRLYEGQVVHMQQIIASKEGQEFQKDRFKLLAELTRLRQICCDPTLLFQDYHGSSAKREACMELVESAIEGGHKILLFSQFTSMLELLAGDLTKEGISFYQITGATPKEERLTLVKEFNQDDTKVFLISLKAGGTGLNLTGADVVIHYDPWWNQAAQNQATDRAHRIGQTKKVTVYQLIAKNTIEEKILKIQATKKNLADQIISGEMNQLGSMTREDFLDLLM